MTIDELIDRLQYFKSNLGNVEAKLVDRDDYALPIVLVEGDTTKGSEVVYLYSYDLYYDAPWLHATVKCANSGPE